MKQWGVSVFVSSREISRLFLSVNVRPLGLFRYEYRSSENGDVERKVVFHRCSEAAGNAEQYRKVHCCPEAD